MDVDAELRAAGGVAHEGLLWIPASSPPHWVPNTDNVFTRGQDLEEVLGVDMTMANDASNPGEWWFDGGGHVVAVEVQIKRDPQYTPSPNTTMARWRRHEARLRERAGTYLDEALVIIEGGRGQMDIMTWTNIVRLVGRAQLLNPASTMPVSPTR